MNPAGPLVIPFKQSLCWLILALLVGTGLRAAESAAPDPYAEEPYWYQPGHPVEPAQASALRTLPGFSAERVLTVPREWGSWVALAVDPAGRLIAAAQHEPGLFRVTLPRASEPEAAVKVERMGGAAATIGWAHGLLYAFDSLYVTVAEEADLTTGVYRLMDTDGDGVFDERRRLFGLQGSGEHGPHGIVAGPDGRSLFLMVGNGTAVPDAITQRRPVATTGIDRAMPPGFESSSHSAQGWVLRFSPDGTEREVFCSGLRNPYDLAFNRHGELFTYDSDDEWDLGTPWYRPTRVVHLVSGGEYGWRGGGAVWPDHLEDSVAPVLNIGPGSPTGLAFGYASDFPARYQEALFVGDWTFGAIHAVFLTPDGAGYRAESEEFIGGSGLPVTDLVFGADGALYVTVGGRRLGSALYRIRYTGTQDSAGAAAAMTPPDALVELRRQLEHAHRPGAPGAVERVWPYLGHPDRSIRFAARVALEHQPLVQWRDRVGREPAGAAQLTALLALARQGDEDDQRRVLARLMQRPFAEWPPDDRLRILRIGELALSRGGVGVIVAAARWRAQLSAAFPDASPTVTRELGRMLALLGAREQIDASLAVMAADRGTPPLQGRESFTRNPKYGQALREMLEAAPLVERMHHAQTLLWVAEHWSSAQRRRYFELVGDAMTYSRGGHLYVQFWERIRDAALELAPVAERDALAALASPPAAEADRLPTPEGPGREWTVAEVVALATERLRSRDFQRGRQMFAAASCQTCHRLAGEGGVMGPSLVGLGDRFTLQDVVEAIVEPSRAISDQYRMTLITTTDGDVVSGRLLSRDAEVTRVAPNLLRPGQLVTIENTRIAEESQLAASTMPLGLLNRLNADEVLDLLAYLLSGGNPEHPYFAPGRAPSSPTGGSPD